MKYKKIEKTKPVTTRKQGWWITCQMVDDILVLNVWLNKKLQARHAVNTKTYEYATLKGGIWSNTKVEHAIGMPVEMYGEGYWHGSRYEEVEKERFRISRTDEFVIKEYLDKKNRYKKYTTTMELITDQESDFGREKRKKTEHNRWNRVLEVMNKIPKVPADIWEWVDKACFQSMDYCLMDKESGKWSCSACGTTYDNKEIKKIDTKYGLDKGGRLRHNDLLECPVCGKEIILKKRNSWVRHCVRFCVIQPIDDKISVARHFKTALQCNPGKKRKLIIQEQIRIVMFKNSTKSQCSIYYMQYGFENYLVEKGKEYIIGDFDNRSNPTQRETASCYLYDDGIQEAFQNTAYEPWSRLFAEWAAAGQKLDYNWMMTAYKWQEYIDMMEMLWRGRFYRLLREESERIRHWEPHKYCGNLYLQESEIEEVFYIADRQKINRIRDRNGGNLMLQWMRFSDRHNQKISDKALDWLEKNNITPDDMQWIKLRFSVEQAMNYIERQRKESYKGKRVKQVISQYEDYMSMCEKLHKDTSDELVYRPRELKRRHDECVAAIERQKAQIKAEEYSQKFGEAEKVLCRIRDKFEYTGEEYFIKVPQRIVDIVTEGNFLHHCAGATDRYFDRIKQNETYICFLRKITEPDTPFYTIEVEPGGTIRQHRGMYDEEPDIDKVKPFLREWQKEIRKRMRKEDHELAAVAKEKREANIEELKAKNNTRVLQGLMEDFMEAAGL